MKARQFEALGYWADERVPDLSSIVAPLRVDARSFSRWLGPLAGGYRGSETTRDQMPTPAQELEALVLFSKHAAAVRAALRPRGLGPKTQVHMSYAGLLRDVHTSDVVKRVSLDSVMLGVFAAGGGLSFNHRGMFGMPLLIESVSCAAPTLNSTPGPGATFTPLLPAA